MTTPAPDGRIPIPDSQLAALKDAGYAVVPQLKLERLRQAALRGRMRADNPVIVNAFAAAMWLLTRPFGSGLTWESVDDQDKDGFRSRARFILAWVADTTDTTGADDD